MLPPGVPGQAQGDQEEPVGGRMGTLKTGTLQLVPTGPYLVLYLT